MSSEVTPDSSAAAPSMAGAAAEGGSPAARAYKEQLAREGKEVNIAGVSFDTPANAAPAGSKPPGIEARAAERKLLPGRARVAVTGGAMMSGKLVDISATGISIMMDDPLPTKKVCVLECESFKNGRLYAFMVQAVSVHGVLVSGKGFKVGFQFGPRTPAAAKTIEELMT